MFRIVILLGITLAVEGQSIPPTYSPARRSPALGTAVPGNMPSMIASAGPTIRTTSSMPATNSPPITPTAPTSLAPGVVLTFPPIILANFPTPQGGFAVCQACSEGYFVRDKNAVVTFAGVSFTCRDLEAAGFQRLIPDVICTDSLTNAVLEACGCDEIIFSVAPSSTLQAATMAPNIPTMTASARPTMRDTASMPVANPPPSSVAVTAPTAPTSLAPGVVLTFPPIILANFPTPQGGFAVCQACSEGYFVRDKNAVVTFAGVSFTCRDLEAAGFQRLIPDAICTDSLTNAVIAACGCDEIIYSVAPSSTSPVATTAPTNVVDSTMLPSSNTPQVAPTKSAGFTIMSGITTGSVLATGSSLLLLFVVL